MAQRYGSAVIVLHVREYERYEGSDVDLGPPVPAEDLVNGVLATFRQGGVEAQGEIRRVSSGNTHQQIIEVAAATQADMIIIGSIGMIEWNSILLGRVAKKVWHQ